MVSKQIAVVFTILGGVFYVFGSFVGGLLFGPVFGAASVLGSIASPARGLSLADASAATQVVLAFGIIAAALIIVGGALLNSEQGSRRKAGGVLALVMMVLGAIPDVGGFLLGFIFVLVGSVLGLTYKEASPEQTAVPARTTSLYESQGPQGPLTFEKSSTGLYCIKCGKQLYEGAVFCKYCGSPVPK